MCVICLARVRARSCCTNVAYPAFRSSPLRSARSLWEKRDTSSGWLQPKFLYPVLPFPCFSAASNSLPVFPFFSRDFRASVWPKNPCFLVVFLAFFFSQKARKGRTGMLIFKTKISLPRQEHLLQTIGIHTLKLESA